jgi:hypothetical protein
LDGYNDAYSMAADPAHGSIYYGRTGSDTTRGVYRMGMDGSNPHRVASVPTQCPYGISVDSTGGKIYFNYGLDTIRQTNLDGTGPVDIVTGQDYVYDIDIDVARGLVYWIDASTEIWRAPIDGSSPPEEILAASAGKQPLTLALSPDGDRVYFGNGSYSHEVWRMNANGSGLEYVTYAYKPVAIDVVPEPTTLALLAGGCLVLLGRRPYQSFMRR